MCELETDLEFKKVVTIALQAILDSNIEIMQKLGLNLALQKDTRDTLALMTNDLV